MDLNRRGFLGALFALPVVATTQEGWFTWAKRKTVEVAVRGMVWVDMASRSVTRIVTGFEPVRTYKPMRGRGHTMYQEVAVEGEVEAGDWVEWNEDHTAVRKATGGTVVGMVPPDLKDLP